MLSIVLVYGTWITDTMPFLVYGDEDWHFDAYWTLLMYVIRMSFV